MNTQEKKVVRWKRDLIAANVTIDDVTIQRLKSHDLIWDSVVAELNEVAVDVVVVADVAVVAFVVDFVVVADVVGAVCSWGCCC